MSNKTMTKAENSLEEQGVQGDSEASGPRAESTHSHITELWCHEPPPLLQGS